MKISFFALQLQAKIKNLFLDSGVYSTRESVETPEFDSRVDRTRESSPSRVRVENFRLVRNPGKDMFILLKAKKNEK